jgi:hypothetical protein
MTTPTPTMPNYEFHPLAELFPLMEGDEFDNFCADIHQHGLREQITLHEGKILDGRNRYRAAIRVGRTLYLPEAIRSLRITSFAGSRGEFKIRQRRPKWR